MANPFRVTPHVDLVVEWDTGDHEEAERLLQGAVDEVRAQIRQATSTPDPARPREPLPFDWETPGRRPCACKAWPEEDVTLPPHTADQHLEVHARTWLGNAAVDAALQQMAEGLLGLLPSGGQTDPGAAQ